MIEIKNLTKNYGDRAVLNIGSLTVKKGETVVIVGPNGSGKSTLLKILAGILPKSGGDFTVNGSLYYMPQQSVPFRKTVKKNLIFSAKGENKEKKAENMLSLLSLTDFADKNAAGLSGGECQRLALGRVLINEGDFLLLDEPSSAADIEGTEIIEKAVAEYKRKTGCGILMTTHSPGQARRMADRIVILYNGEIAEEGAPEELLSSPKSVWGKKFIDMWKFDN
ncbi:MAG: ABC transporter ATP-binding protein [Ruminococcaceae bacterium]|nr:ABC transporter ATP-binding protein [Oscillospiraceae bacterium]